MEATTRTGLIDRLRVYDPVVELAVGRRSSVAVGLAASNDVTATDLHERSIPAGVRFVQDDLTDPEYAVYEGAEALYALNLPEELHRPALELAEAVDVALAFTTLGYEPPAVPTARREPVGCDTLFWIRERRGGPAPHGPFTPP